MKVFPKMLCQLWGVISRKLKKKNKKNLFVYGKGLKFILNFRHQLQSQDKPEKLTKVRCVMKSFL